MIRIPTFPLLLLLVGGAPFTSAFSSSIKPASRQKTTFLEYRSNGTGTEAIASSEITLPLDFEEASPLEGLLLEPPQQAEETTTTTVATTTKQEPLSDVVKARLLLLASAALYGTNFSLVKILGETGMSAGLSSTLRFGLAALATLPWLFSLEDEQRHASRRFEKLFDPKGVEFQAAMGGLEVGMWNCIGYVAQAVGLETTSASKSAFLCSLAVVMVPLLDYLAGKTLLSKQVVGTLLAVVGVAFLELDGTGMSLTHLEGGDIASLIQPIAFGLGFWRMESAMAKHPEEADRATAAQLLAVFLGSAGYMMVTGVADPSSLPPMDQFVSWMTDPAVLGALFWTGVVTTALTIYMETVALKTLSAAETTLIFSTEPLWGSAFAFAVMGETFGLNAAAGAVMILSGCVYSNLGISGLMNFLPWNNDNVDQDALYNMTKEQNERFERFLKEDAPIAASPNIFPTNPLGKVSLRSVVAGALTGIVALVESVSGSPPTIEPEELKEFLELMNID